MKLGRKLLFILNDDERQPKRQHQSANGKKIIRLRLKGVAQHQAHGGSGKEQHTHSVQRPVPAQQKIVEVVQLDRKSVV